MREFSKGEFKVKMKIFYEAKQDAEGSGFRWACEGSFNAKVYMGVPTFEDVKRMAKRRYPEHDLEFIATPFPI